MIEMGKKYMGRVTGTEIIPNYIYRDHSIQEMFVVYSIPGGELREARIKAFKIMFRKVNLPG